MKTWIDLQYDSSDVQAIFPYLRLWNAYKLYVYISEKEVITY